MIGRIRFSRETEMPNLFIQTFNSNPDQILQPSHRLSEGLAKSRSGLLDRIRPR
jgi:hypothetical protein